MRAAGSARFAVSAMIRLGRNTTRSRGKPPR